MTRDSVSRSAGNPLESVVNRDAPYPGTLQPVRAVATRVQQRLDELYAIGGGTRAGYSPEEDASHELAAGWMQEAGLEVSRDEAGNLFGRRGAACVWSGSHLDTVPNGGRFD